MFFASLKDCLFGLVGRVLLCLAGVSPRAAAGLVGVLSAGDLAVGSGVVDSIGILCRLRV